MQLFRGAKNYLIYTWHKHNKNKGPQSERVTDYREILLKVRLNSDLDRNVFEFPEL